MKKSILSWVVLLASGLMAKEVPCTNITCDSLAVRSILDENGQQSTEVNQVIGDLTDRIVYLKFFPHTINHIPSTIGKLVKLYIVDVSYNDLTTLPPEIGDLTRLSTLILNDNKITQLPDTIGTIEDLEFLRLENNKLKSLPASIGKLPILKLLYLDSNQLTTLPSEIANDTALKYLHLTNNLIKTLPASVTNLNLAAGEDLAGLYVQGNCLTSVPLAVSNWINKYNRSFYKDGTGNFNNLWKGFQYCGSQTFSVPIYNKSTCTEPSKLPMSKSAP